MFFPPLPDFAINLYWIAVRMALILAGGVSLQTFTATTVFLMPLNAR